MGNSVDLDEVAHNEPPHQDLSCLQIQLFSSLVLIELKIVLRDLGCYRRFVSSFMQFALSLWRILVILPLSIHLVMGSRLK